MTTETRPGIETETGESRQLDNVSPGRINGRFARGIKLGPGRPRRGQSVPEKLKAKVERHGDAVVKAAYERLLRTDSVGNRAFADMRDTVYGVPKQTLVLQQGDDPLALLLPRLLNDAETVEGEYTVN